MRAIDKHGADLLFQIISGRYERGSIILSTNKAFKHWPGIFNNDATLTSAILDRIAPDPEGQWMKQVARNLTDPLAGFLPLGELLRGAHHGAVALTRRAPSAGCGCLWGQSMACRPPSPSARPSRFRRWG
jgi:hypothetical protein